MREMGNWRDYQIERLTNDREAAIDYLQLTLEEYLVDGDLPFFLKGLQTFVESQGGVSEFSKRTSSENELTLLLYRSFPPGMFHYPYSDRDYLLNKAREQ